MKHPAIALCGLCALLLFATSDTWSQGSDVAASDFDGNGKVDFSDFLIFAGGFGKTSGEEGFDARLDLSGNGTIDFDDFLFFTRHFGRSTSESVQTLLYIVDLTGGKIEIVDPATNLLDPSRTIWVSQPRGIAVSDIDRQIYVAAIDTFHAFNQNGTRNYQISLTEPVFEPGQVVDSRGGFKVALSLNHQFAFVTEGSASLVEIFDVRQRLSVAQIPVLQNPSSIAITPDGSEVYVAHGHDLAPRPRPLSVIDGLQHTLKDSIPVGGVNANRIALTSDGQRLYLNSLRSGQIQVVNPLARAVVDSFTVGDPSDLGVQIQDVAVSEDGSRLYAIANRTILGFDPAGNPAPGFTASLFIIDTATFTPVAEINVGQLIGTLGVTPDGKTAYVSGVETLDLTGGGTPKLQIFIVDLENRENLGTLRGFDLPVEFKFRAGKPALNALALPEIAVF